MTFVLAMLLVQQLKATKTMGCFVNRHALLASFPSNLFEPHNPGGGTVWIPIGNRKFRRVVFRPGKSCKAGYKFRIVYDDVVTDLVTNPHPSAKKKSSFVSIFGNATSKPGGA